jgi:hypothetical protein
LEPMKPAAPVMSRFMGVPLESAVGEGFVQDAFDIVEQKAGSDPHKCLLLRDNQFKNWGFFLLKDTFWGQKVPFKSWGALVFSLSEIPTGFYCPLSDMRSRSGGTRILVRAVQTA